MSVILKQIITISIGTMLSVLSMVTYADDKDIERIVWDYKPIKITLEVGKERQIFFPKGTQVKVYRPGKLKGKLRHMAVDNVVYWKAHEAFDMTRITAEELSEGSDKRIYLIDLSADKASQSAAPIEIVSRVPSGKSNIVKEETETVQIKKKNAKQDMVGLVRYASQSLYAPKRVLHDINERIPGVIRTAVPSDSMYKLYRSGIVTAQPIAGWKTDNLYVTAVALKNTMDTPIELDQREIKGQFKSATFQHNPPILAPKGHPADTTTVYLVSARSFKASTQFVQQVGKPKAIKMVEKPAAKYDDTDEEE